MPDFCEHVESPPCPRGCYDNSWDKRRLDALHRDGRLCDICGRALELSEPRCSKRNDGKMVCFNCGHNEAQFKGTATGSRDDGVIRGEFEVKVLTPEAREEALTADSLVLIASRTMVEGLLQSRNAALATRDTIQRDANQELARHREVEDKLRNTIDVLQENVRALLGERAQREEQEQKRRRDAGVQLKEYREQLTRLSERLGEIHAERSPQAQSDGAVLETVARLEADCGRLNEEKASLLSMLGRTTCPACYFGMRALAADPNCDRCRNDRAMIAKLAEGKDMRVPFFYDGKCTHCQAPDPKSPRGLALNRLLKAVEDLAPASLTGRSSFGLIIRSQLARLRDAVEAWQKL